MKTTEEKKKKKKEETDVCLSSFMKFTVKLPDLGLIMATLFVLFALS